MTEIEIKPYPGCEPVELLPLCEAISRTNFTDRPDMPEAAFLRP